MNTKYFLSFIVLSFGIAIFGVLIGQTLAQISAQTEPDIQYPVKELGNCRNEADCRAYCDKSENIKACINFAEKNNLMDEEEIERAKKFIAAGAKGPGGCTGKDNCEEYCNNISHIDECISFAEKNNLIPPDELAEAKKVQAAIKRGVKPPPCGNKKQCDVYCGEPDHMEECIAFGMEAGFIQGKEFEDAQKMLMAIKRGIRPPPCSGKKDCDEYCGNPDNMEACINFAIEAGFMDEREKEDGQKMLQALKKGVKPPPCRGREECDVYCSEESHLEECMKFAEAAGFMSAEEAAMARKTGGKGPSGCKGRNECEAFCNNPDNQETCFNFGKEHGLIPEADLRQMEEGRQKFQESLNQAPPEVKECLGAAMGAEQMEKFQSGAVMPGREIGDKMRECFEKNMGPAGGPKFIGPPIKSNGQMPMEMTGPGGCKTSEECKTYCETNPEECKNFQVPTRDMRGDASIGIPERMPEGPGGCLTKEECQSYCQFHLEECQRFYSAPTIPMGPQIPSSIEGQEFPEGTAPNGMMPPEGVMPPPSTLISPELLFGLILNILFNF